MELKQPRPLPPTTSSPILQLTLLLFLIIICSGVAGGMVHLVGQWFGLDYSESTTTLLPSSSTGEKNFIRISLGISQIMTFLVPALVFMWTLYSNKSWQQLRLEVVINLLVIAILPALGEELVFRGVIQQKIAEQISVHGAIWLTAILFSTIHLQFQGFLPRMLLGAVLGYLFFWSKNLWIPIFAQTTLFISDFGSSSAFFNSWFTIEKSLIAIWNIRRVLSVMTLASFFSLLVIVSCAITGLNRNNNIPTTIEFFFIWILL